MPEFYLRRQIDTDLRAQVVKWLNSEDCAGWITLTSEPGHGNSLLLRNLANEIATDSLFSNTTARPVLVQACTRDPLRPPSDIPPLVMELQELIEGLESSLPARLRRLGKAGAWCSLVGLAAFLISAIFELHSSDLKLNILSPAFYVDLLGFIPQHWTTVASLATLGIASGLLQSRFSRVLTKILRRDTASVRIESSRELYEDSKTVYPLLNRAADGAGALILLVDDLYDSDNATQKWNLESFLRDLVSDSSSDMAEKFRRSHRVLVVALDCPEGQDIWPAASKFVKLIVPPFDSAEVAQIADNIPASTEAISPDTLASARENINRLFDGKRTELGLRVKKAFDNIADLGETAQVTLADLIAFIAFSGRTKISLWNAKAWFSDSAISELWPSLQSIGLINVNARIFERLRSSIFVREKEGTIYVDEPAVAAFRQLTKEHPNYRMFALRALYCWFDNARRQDTNRAGWYALQFTQFIQDDEREAFSALRMTPDTAHTFARQMADALLKRAEALVNIGSIVPAKPFAWYSEGWIQLIPEPDAQLPRHRMWWILGEIHFLCGDKTLGEDLLKVRQEDVNLREDPLLTVYADLEGLFRGSPKKQQRFLQPLDWMPDEYRHKLLDLVLLDETLWTARTQAGYWWNAYRVAGLASKDPETPYRPGVPRTIYRYFQLMCALFQDDLTRVEKIARDWKTEAMQNAPGESGRMGEALQSWNRAMFLFGGISIHFYGQPSEAALQISLALLETTREAFSERLNDILRHFETACQMLSMLGMDRVLIHAYRSSGTFEWVSTNFLNSPKRHWNKLWNRCLHLEAAHHWHYYTPDIYHDRYEQLDAEDKAAGLDHHKRFCEEALIAGYPLYFVLFHFRNLRKDIVNHGTEPRHNEMGAELYLLWADKQMFYPMARPLWQYKREDLERADAYYWAAFCYGRASRLDLEQTWLDKSVQMVAAVFQGSYEAACDQEEFGDLVRFQQREIHYRTVEAKRYEAADKALRLLWRTFKPGSFCATTTICDSLSRDHRMGTLSRALPADEKVIVGHTPEQPPDTFGLESTVLSVWELRMWQLMAVLGKFPAAEDETGLRKFARVLEGYDYLGWLGPTFLAVVNPEDIRPAYRSTLNALLKTELFYNKYNVPDLRNVIRVLQSLAQISLGDERWISELNEAKRKQDILRLRKVPIGLDWFRRMDAWMDGMSMDDADLGVHRHRVERRAKLLTSIKPRMLGGEFLTVRESVMSELSELSQPVLKEEIVLLNIGVHAAARALPFDDEGLRILDQRYWQARELFIAQLNLPPADSAQFSARMTDLFDESNTAHAAHG